MFDIVTFLLQSLLVAANLKELHISYVTLALHCINKLH